MLNLKPQLVHIGLRHRSWVSCIARKPGYSLRVLGVSRFGSVITVWLLQLDGLYFVPEGLYGTLIDFATLAAVVSYQRY